MLDFNGKIDFLKSELLTQNDTYSDSFKTDLMFYFDEFVIENPKLKFLNKLNSEIEIQNWLETLLNRIVLKFNENEESLSDFIFYHMNNK